MSAMGRKQTFGLNVRNGWKADLGVAGHEASVAFVPLLQSFVQDDAEDWAKYEPQTYVRNQKTEEQAEAHA